MRPSLISALLLAEFDIDRGSTLRQTWPMELMSSLPLTANVIAEMMLPEGGHNRSDDSTVFLFHREKGGYCLTQGAEGDEVTISAVGDECSGSHDVEPRLLFCYSVVMTRRDETVRRGAVMRSLAVCSPYQFLDLFHSVLFNTLEKYFSGPDPTILADLFTTLSTFDLSPLPLLTRRQRTALRNCITLKRKCVSDVDPAESLVPITHTLTLTHDSKTYPVIVPLTLEADVLASASLSMLFSKFGRQCGTLYNAILVEKRVLFCGDKTTAASEVGACVIAAVAMLSPSLTGVMRRAYPYACLTQLDFLSQPGFIAGVTNPMFATKPQWWDVMANVATGEVTTAEQALAASTSSASSPALPPGLSTVALYSSGDLPEWKPLDEIVFEKIAAGAAFGEMWLRDAVASHTSALLQLCGKYVDWKAAVVAAKAAAIDGESAPTIAAAPRIMTANTSRLDLMLASTQYRLYADRKDRQWDLAGSCFHASVDPEGTLRSHVSALKSGSSLKPAAMRQLFADLEGSVLTPADCEGLVVLLPEGIGGLHCLTVGLFHEDLRVRGSCWRLLHRLETCSSQIPKAAFGNLNMFVMMAYQRVGAQLLAADRTDSDDTATK